MFFVLYFVAVGSPPIISGRVPIKLCRRFCHCLDISPIAKTLESILLEHKKGMGIGFRKYSRPTGGIPNKSILFSSIRRIVFNFEPLDPSFFNLYFRIRNTGDNAVPDQQFTANSSCHLRHGNTLDELDYWMGSPAGKL